MRRLDLLWASSAAVILVTGLSWLPRGPELSDSYDPGPSGKKAYYSLARLMRADVSRSVQELIPPRADTLVMLGPARYPDRAQWQSLYDWVAAGHALVFAARYDDPAVRLDPFGLEVEPRGGLDAEGSSAAFRSLGAIAYASDDVSVVLSDETGPQVVIRAIGAGAIVVAASDFIFTNRALSNEDNAVLAYRLLEKADPSGLVVFDETMNAAGGASIMRVLAGPRLQGASAQVVLVLVLTGWMFHRSAGPTRWFPERAGGSVEHAKARGRLRFAIERGLPKQERTNG